MAADSLRLFPTIQFIDAFRMVRYSYSYPHRHRYSAKYVSEESRYKDSHSYSYSYSNSNKNYSYDYSICHNTLLFATQNNKNNNSNPQQQGTTSTSNDPFGATASDNELFKTLAGGTALIFEMARKSMLFATKEPDTKNQPTKNAKTTAKRTTTTPNEQQARPQPPPQGRWYPHSGIADVNPNFRTQAPTMTNQGFARSIWKNARKRNKPSLWKHALRTYDRMALLEGDPNFAQIQRANIHHEGAMQACAKLGLWQRALEIYHFVYQEDMGEERQSQLDGLQQLKPSSAGRNKINNNKSSNGSNKNERAGDRVCVTDDMILSLVRATVRASRLRSRKKMKSYDPPLSPEQEEQEAAMRRIPLDTALEILSRLTEDHGIPLVAYYLNPIAAAYQSLGYTAFSKEILETMLSNRTAGEDEIWNVNDLCAKDKGSYSLLVQASVVTGDWGAAVDSLTEMTDAGLYPNPRHCNMWSEISERQTRPRAVGSLKKKRDDFWTDSIR